MKCLCVFQMTVHVYDVCVRVSDDGAGDRERARQEHGSVPLPAGEGRV